MARLVRSPTCHVGLAYGRAAQGGAGQQVPGRAQVGSRAIGGVGGAHPWLGHEGRQPGLERHIVELLGVAVPVLGRNFGLRVVVSQVHGRPMGSLNGVMMGVQAQHGGFRGQYAPQQQQ